MVGNKVAARFSSWASVGLDGDWAGTTLSLPTGQWIDQFTQRVFTGQVALASLLEEFPVSLLLREV